ncbi:MAG: dephospho-CoA kinase [Proteobacteria bacterium]|nr:dephospho-CoA kinase [Pseudomonadota bacterium]
MARFVVAVTGGIASGKSEACRCFERLGMAVADADAIARETVAPGQPALAAIVERFGNAVLAGDGSLDRAVLRKLVFADAATRHELEAILHPLIREALRTACAAARSPYAIAAIPLLAEGGGRSAYPWLDRILVIDVSPEVQLARLLARDGDTREQALRILAAQATRDQRLAIADDAIVNDGTPEALSKNVAAVHARYLLAAAANP